MRQRVRPRSGRFLTGVMTGETKRALSLARVLALSASFFSICVQVVNDKALANRWSRLPAGHQLHDTIRQTPGSWKCEQHQCESDSGMITDSRLHSMIYATRLAKTPPRSERIARSSTFDRRLQIVLPCPSSTCNLQPPSLLTIR